ncbi:MAG: glycosyltransferase family 2 protein, partial [Selenomonadaceae bacterium]|nr:glycosyltransferase family 2 protein [Selenomonadaceae bacterium]
MPKVSVILTSYNHGAFVAAAIKSVLKQTFTDFELLLVDDGSQDDSQDIIKAFDDPRIKTFLYDENRGPVIAVSEAIESARGKYIAVHHSDDLWTPDKLEKQVAFLDSNENFAACFTWVEFVDEFGKPRELDAGDYYKNIFDQPNRTRAEWLNYFFYNANCLCHPSVMLRRKVVEKFQLYEAHGFWQLPDYLAWIRLCFHADIFILPK